MTIRESEESIDPQNRSTDSDYFAAIEIRFQQLRGTPILVSPRDWQRIATWRDMGIPKNVVLQGIEMAFKRKKQVAGDGSIRSLAYCEPFVHEHWNRQRSESVTRREAHRGTPANRWDAESILAHLSRTRITLIRSLENVGSRRPSLADHLRTLADRVAQETGKINSRSTPEAIQDLETRLTAWEEQLASAGRKVLTPEERQRIQTEVEGELSAYREGMSEETYRETRRVILNDRIRRFHSLPRLSLFSLP